VTLAYRLDGPADAPVLVLSSSLGTTTSMWEPQLDAFTASFCVLRHDHPGHGASPPPVGPVSVETIARGVLELLDELGISHASFCGLSLGGMVGMWLGANAADRIDRLVLSCTGASIGTPEGYRERAEMVRREGVAVTVAGAGERWFTPAFRDSAAARRLLDELLTISPDGYAACCEAVGNFDFHDDLRRIAPPTLVVVGEDDPVIPPSAGAELAAGIPDATLTTIAGAAHLANVEQPDAFAAAVLSHLEERAAA
jgi:3-oxoadipate enol-lactonase